MNIIFSYFNSGSHPKIQLVKVDLPDPVTPKIIKQFLFKKASLFFLLIFSNSVNDTISIPRFSFKLLIFGKFILRKFNSFRNELILIF